MLRTHLQSHFMDASLANIDFDVNLSDCGGAVYISAFVDQIESFLPDLLKEILNFQINKNHLPDYISLFRQSIGNYFADEPHEITEREADKFLNNDYDFSIDEEYKKQAEVIKNVFFYLLQPKIKLIIGIHKMLIKDFLRKIF